MKKIDHETSESKGRVHFLWSETGKKDLLEEIRIMQYPGI